MGIESCLPVGVPASDRRRLSSESANNCKETVKQMKEEEERRIDERVNRTEST